PATPEISTLSLHDALPIWLARPLPERSAERRRRRPRRQRDARDVPDPPSLPPARRELQEPRDGGSADAASLSTPRSPGVRVRSGDRKSTRLNSSHVAISYA